MGEKEEGGLEKEEVKEKGERKKPVVNRIQLSTHNVAKGHLP